VTAAAVAIAAVGIAAFVVVWFQPQKLFIDDRVDEGLPRGGPVTTTLSIAPFRSREHATQGRARVIRLSDGRRYVRFERFSTSNGPLLKVYLSAARADGPAGAFDDRVVDLGGLKGNIGDQNYAVPPRTNLRAYRSVVVWCKRFGVPFAAAPIGSGDGSA
jgi:electron transfer DM13